jgi:hypothetical protein
MGKKYYAAHSSHGFANGVRLVRFADKQTRDDWVEERKDVGVRGACAVTYEDFEYLVLHHSNSWVTNYDTKKPQKKKEKTLFRVDTTPPLWYYISRLREGGTSPPPTDNSRPRRQKDGQKVLRST